jgi:hypothetical protein
MATGRYLIEFPEVAGGLAELHPVYAIRYSLDKVG